MTEVRKDLDDKKSRRFSDVAGMALAVEGTAAVGLTKAMPVSYPYLYGDPAAPPWELNQVKGAAGENLMDRVVTNQFFSETGGWVSCPPRSGPQGLDGLYVRANSQGQLRPPLVVESKYGSSGLSQTAAGRQMSEGWIRPRMAGPAQTYRTLTWGKDATVVRHSYVPEDVEAAPVPLSNSERAYVWREDSGVYHVHAPEGRSVGEVRVQTRQTADMLSGTAAGKVDYRARLFRYRVTDGEHEIVLQSLSSDGTVVTGPGGEQVQRVIRGSAEELPGPFRKALRLAFKRALVEKGNLPRFAARRLAKHAVENPEFADRMGLTPRGDGYVSIIGGIISGTKVGIAGGLTAGAVAAIQEAFRDGEFDFGRVGTTAAVGAASATLAYASGAAIHYGLVSTEVGSQIAGMMPTDQIAGQSVERVLGTVGGSMVGSTAFVVGMYLAGDYTPRESRRLMGRSLVRVLATKGATATAMGGAAALGTASTGTAISSLSGAAAQSATLAWWGGGSLASGGLGMAGGAAALTGIGAVIGVVAFAGTGYYFKRRDEAEQKATIEARLDLVEERVAKGEQPEWQ